MVSDLRAAVAGGAGCRWFRRHVRRVAGRPSAGRRDRSAAGGGPAGQRAGQRLAACLASAARQSSRAGAGSAGRPRRRRARSGRIAGACDGAGPYSGGRPGSGLPEVRASRAAAAARHGRFRRRNRCHPSSGRGLRTAPRRMCTGPCTAFGFKAKTICSPEFEHPAAAPSRIAAAGTAQPAILAAQIRSWSSTTLPSHSTWSRSGPAAGRASRPDQRRLIRLGAAQRPPPLVDHGQPTQLLGAEVRPASERPGRNEREACVASS